MIRVSADVDECMGYGNCVLGAEDYFDEVDGVVQLLRTDVEEADLPRVEEAIGACPVMALKLEK